LYSLYAWFDSVWTSADAVNVRVIIVLDSHGIDVTLLEKMSAVNNGTA